MPNIYLSLIRVMFAAGGGLTMKALTLTPGEERFCEAIRAKDAALRAFIKSNELTRPVETIPWLKYLTAIKIALGNLNNDLSFIATLLVKSYLQRRFSITDFDAAEKPQGAPGIDIECRTADGKIIIGELKTTKPYQPGFGAAQRHLDFEGSHSISKRRVG